MKTDRRRGEITLLLVKTYNGSNLTITTVIIVIVLGVIFIPNKKSGRPITRAEFNPGRSGKGSRKL